jgi:hypothetical protein
MVALTGRLPAVPSTPAGGDRPHCHARRSRAGAGRSGTRTRDAPRSVPGGRRGDRPAVVQRPHARHADQQRREGGWRTLEAGGLAERFDRLLGVDGVDSFKPHPACYAYGVAEVGVPPEDIMFVAAHGWDITGAHAAGLHTTWISRGEARSARWRPSPTSARPTFSTSRVSSAPARGHARSAAAPAHPREPGGRQRRSRRRWSARCRQARARSPRTAGGGAARVDERAHAP